MDSLPNKAPKTHKAMMILQVFDPETGDPATFIEQCNRVDTTDNIAMANLSSSDKDSNSNKNYKRYMNTK